MFFLSMLFSLFLEGIIMVCVMNVLFVLVVLVFERIVCIVVVMVLFILNDCSLFLIRFR